MTGQGRMIYISGPMTGKKDNNCPAFIATENALSTLGWLVLNPARNFGGRHGLPRAAYMRIDYSNLLQAQAIYMLPGWENSSGAVSELRIAMELGLLIFFDDKAKRGIAYVGARCGKEDTQPRDKWLRDPER